MSTEANTELQPAPAALPEPPLLAQSPAAAPVPAEAQPPALVVNQPVQPAIVRTWDNLRGMGKVFVMSEWIVRDQFSFYDEVRLGFDLGPKIRGMLFSSIGHLVLYGLVLGFSNSIPQALLSAVKLPVLFFFTLLICLPALYYFNLMYGSQLTFSQVTALILGALTITSVLALAFAPVALFFWLSSLDYHFFILLNVGILALTSWWGLTYLRRGMRYVQHEASIGSRRRILTIWILLYGFVGTQMGWMLRPFFGAPGQPFVFVRQGPGTFYSSIVSIIYSILQGWLGL